MTELGEGRVGPVGVVVNAFGPAVSYEKELHDPRVSAL